MTGMANAAAGSETYSEPLLSPEEAAARLRCSAYTLARWRLEGRGPAWRRIGPRRVAYTMRDLNAFMAQAS